MIVQMRDGNDGWRPGRSWYQHPFVVALGIFLIVYGAVMAVVNIRQWWETRARLSAGETKAKQTGPVTIENPIYWHMSEGDSTGSIRLSGNGSYTTPDGAAVFMHTKTSLPKTCAVGDYVMILNDDQELRVYYCASTNIWKPDQMNSVESDPMCLRARITKQTKAKWWQILSPEVELVVEMENGCSYSLGYASAQIVYLDQAGVQIDDDLIVANGLEAGRRARFTERTFNAEAAKATIVRTYGRK